MKYTRGADAAVFALFQGLEESQSDHNLGGIYTGRLRSRQKDVEGIKRKWEEFTGVLVPKRLKTDEFHQSTKGTPPLVATTETVSATAPTATITASSTVNSSELGEGSVDLSIMNYNDIRRELKKRGIPSNGKKIELSERLRHALVLEEDKARREKTIKKKEAPITGSQQVVVDGGAKNGETVTDSIINEVEEIVDSAEGKRDGKTDAPTTTIEETDPMKTVKTVVSKQTPVPRSALKPSKYARADFSNVPAINSSPYVSSSLSKLDQTANVATTSVLSKDALLSCKISSGSNDSSNSDSSNVSAASKPATSSSQSTPSVKSTTVNGSSIGGSYSAVKLLEKKKAIAETKEARMAKYAEMREKAKIGKAAVGSASKSYSSNSNVGALVSKLKSGIAPSAVSSESKPNPIIAKMREKAAAEKSAAPSAPSSQAIKPNATAPLSSVPSVKQSSPQMKSTQHSAVKTTALKNIIDPANKDVSPKKKVDEKPLSPMQTYEMSDRDEESDSDEDSDEDSDDKPKKTIPEWAQRTNLNRALEMQFADGPQRMDPDKIFGEVETCNLEEIFGDVKTKKRYHKRTSSGNWSKDHVTVAEKLAYKRAMGYDKM